MNEDHRLPTVSAYQALQNSVSATKLSTGIALLDSKLGGLFPGQVMEVCGPPGSGKTAIALQLVIDSVNLGYGVIWIDTKGPLPTPRLLALLPDESKLDSITVYRAPTIVSLIALLRNLSKITCHCRTLVIDNLSSPFPTKSRLTLINKVMTCCLKIAAKSSLSVVLTTQMITKLDGHSANLAPSLGQLLSPFCTHRIMLYRQDCFHFASICKTVDGADISVPFIITDTGMTDIPKKRKRKEENEI